MSQNYVEYYNENCCEDQEFINLVCETAGARMKEQFNLPIYAKTGTYPDGSERYSSDPRLIASIFAKIYEAILINLKLSEKTYSNFAINLANRLTIGYTTTEDEDEEKQGNFMIHIKDMGFTPRAYETGDTDMTANQLCTLWNSENIQEQPELISRIAESARKILKQDLAIELQSHEPIMPIFITVYETLVQMIQMRRKEIDEFEFGVNFMSCFWIIAREGEYEDVIDFRPNIDSKLTIKDDASASAKYE